MKYVIFRVTVILFLFAPMFQACVPYLVKDGKSDFKIVLSDSPQLVEQTAAKELKIYLDEITKSNWIIASEKDVSEDVPQILIGNSLRANKFFPEIDPEKIPYDGIEIHLKKNKLLLTGHGQRGVLYAVNTFLEDVLGVRWWTSTEQTIPTYATFKLKPFHISYAPKLIYRQSYYGDALGNPVFAVRMKCNGSRISPEYGDHHRFTYFVHSFFPLIPPEKYFADHPEWFSEIDGVRRHEGAQLCLTNDEMRKELTKNAMEALRNDPGSKFISISANDWFGYCTCKKCNKVAEEEDSQSGPLIRFVNAVAEEIEKEFPDVFVETLAYRYTRKPPKFVKPRLNVLIRFCTIECSFVHPLTAKQNKSFYDDMKGWSKISQHLFIWDYVTNFASYMMPHPNLRVLAPNIRFFVEHGVIGLFAQGDSNCTVGDFVRLRNWIISKLMWDPSLDYNELVREFLVGYYGKKATPFLLEYFDTLINKAESSEAHIGCYQYNTYDWLDYETLCKATEIFDRAIAAAEQESGGDSEFVQRLRREQLPLKYVWLKEYFKFKRYAEMKGEKFLGPEDPIEVCKKFFTICEKYKVSAHRELDTPQKFADFKENMFSRFEKPALIPEEFQNLDHNTWIDVQEYDFQTIFWMTSTSFVDDPAASNDRSIRMPGDHNYWAAVTIPLPIVDPFFEDFGDDTKFKIVAYVRCDATVNDGLAMTFGVSDQRENKVFENKVVTQNNIGVSEIAGLEYKKIELEPILLSRSMYIWFAPPNREKVQAIYIDRALIIKEKIK